MPLLVRLFAGLKAAHGPEIRLEQPLPISIEQLKSELETKNLWTSGARIAVNHSFAPDGTTILEGDEVAVIPPVSGGLG